MGNRLVIDRRLAKELTGRAKLRALIAARYGTMQKFAQVRGLYPQQVTMTLKGDRAYPEVRDALADDLDLPRSEIDRLIDGEVKRQRASVPA